MNGKTFIDTNILIYAHDLDAKDKQTVAKKTLAELWADRTGFLSAQVLQEFYVNVTRKIQNPYLKPMLAPWSKDTRSGASRRHQQI